ALFSSTMSMMCGGVAAAAAVTPPAGVDRPTGTIPASELSAVRRSAAPTARPCRWARVVAIDRFDRHAVGSRLTTRPPITVALPSGPFPKPGVETPVAQETPGHSSVSDTAGAVAPFDLTEEQASARPSRARAGIL